MSKWLRIILYVLAGLVILVAAGLLYIDLRFETILHNKLSKSLTKASGISHTVEFDSANIKVFGTSVSVSGLSVRADSSAIQNDSTAQNSGFTLNADIQRVRITDFSVWQYIFNKKATISTLALERPDIDFRALKKDTASTSSKKNKKGSSLKEVSIDSIGISYPVISYTSAKGDLHHFEGRSLDFGSLKAITKNGRFSVVNKSGNVRSITYDPPGGLYHWKVAATSINLEGGSMTADSIEMVPNFGKVAFMQEAGSQKTRMDMTVGKLQVRDLLTDSLFAKDTQIRMGAIEIDGLNMSLYTDQRFPDKKEMKEMPQGRLQQIDTPIRLDSLTVNGGQIVYEEMSEGDKEPGMITFNNIQAKGSNVSNATSGSDSLMVVDISADFMDQARLTVTYNLDLFSDDQTVHIKGDLAPCKMDIANPMLEHAANVRIQDGESQGMYFNMYLKKEWATGDVRFLYQGLNLVPLGKDEEAGLLDELKGFIAESFVLKKHNPSDKDEEPRIGQVSFERIHYKSIFNYSWKSLLSGLRESLGVSQKKADKASKKAEKKEKRQEEKEDKKAAKRE
ncbi:MAG: hypothetical protein WBB45_11605 [Cyclobacteriaceae bacterium]